MNERKITLIRRAWNPAGGAEGYLLNFGHALTQAGFQTCLLCQEWNGPKDVFAAVEETGGASRRDFIVRATRTLAEITGIRLSMERGLPADLYRAGDGVHRAYLHRRKKSWKRFFSPKDRQELQMENRTFQPTTTGRVVANSELVRQDIRNWTVFPKERITVIPNPVDAARFSSGNRRAGREALGLPERAWVILLVGRGASRKGHREAARAVEDSNTGGRLVIVDSPPPCPMQDIYAAADVFLLPTWYDPFSNATLEAMAAGLPVITTRLNGASMMLKPEENGLLADSPEDVEAMAACLQRLRDSSFAHSLGRAAQAIARSQTWQDHVKAWLPLLAENP